jgi:hypothetical protein
MIGILLHELLDPSCRVNKFLFAGEKGMTGRTDLHIHFSVNRTKLHFVAAGTLSLNFMVFRMDIFFHYFPPNIICTVQQKTSKLSGGLFPGHEGKRDRPFWVINDIIIVTLLPASRQ